MAVQQLDVEGLMAALDAERRNLGLSWRELARRAGVSPSSLTRMQQGKRPDVNTFGALLQWLNVPAERFLTDRHPVGPRSEASQLEGVTALLRGKKELSPDAARALEELVQAAFKLAKELK